MPKHKTHKGLKKRVKVTATGKVKHHSPYCGHLMSGKTAERRRRIGRAAIMNDTMAKKVKIALGK